MLVVHYYIHYYTDIVSELFLNNPTNFINIHINYSIDNHNGMRV